MWSAKTRREADQSLVDGARCLIDADRVSLLHQDKKARNGGVLAISGNPSFDARSDIVIALNQLTLSCDLGSVSKEQLARLASQTGSTIAVAVAIAKTAESNHYLVLEWADTERHIATSERMRWILPWLIDAWQLSSPPVGKQLWRSRVLRWAIASLCLIGLVVYFAIPTELTILSQGTLQPSEQRFVFSPAEGFVDKIHVSDGQRVQAGEVVAILSSPSLQMQFTQVASEIELVEQKRDGLNITLNQLKPAEDQGNLLGSRLAGEVQELEAKRANLIEQKALLEREQERLQLRSPIQGTVIAWEVEKYLENRPVRRGDTLLRIAALENQWQLESTVVDWESGYVMGAYQTRIAKKKPLNVEFVVASSPQERRTGRIVNIGNSMLDVDGSQQMEMTIVPDSSISSPRLGTSVTVSIPCGQFPRWFVWTRGILDAVRRRFWI